MKVKLTVHCETEQDATSPDEAVEQFRTFICENPTFLWDSITAELVVEGEKS